MIKVSNLNPRTMEIISNYCWSPRPIVNFIGRGLVLYTEADTLVAKAQELRRRRCNLDGEKRVARKLVHEVRVQRNLRTCSLKNYQKCS